MKNVADQIVIVLTAITTVALVAVLVGKNAKTVDVIKAAGSAFVDSLKAAVSPVN